MQKLLVGLNSSKPAGRNCLPCHFLKEMAPELAPILTSIFNPSLGCSTVPTLWTEAFIALVFKKGARCVPENYRPVSLTCVSCKILEHIIMRHFLTHFERHGILPPFNHGFRSKLSCETRLLLTLQDLLTFCDHKIQVDMAILDFSKAFNTIPHGHLLLVREDGVLWYTGPSIEMDCLLLEDKIIISACRGEIF